MAMFSGAPSVWDAEPPHDPVASARSAAIDDWLRSERAKELSERCTALILSPDGEVFDAFRERVFGFLGEKVDLGAEDDNHHVTVSVSTESVRKKEKKRLQGMEPSLLVYAVDPGQESDPIKLLDNARKALAHFLFTTRSIGLGKGCAVIVVVARTKLMKEAARTQHRELWEKMFPLLQFGSGDIQKAIAEEFEQAAKAYSDPLQVKFLFDSGDFSDLSALRPLMRDSHKAIIESLGPQLASTSTNQREEFHDAHQPPQESIKETTVKAEIVPESIRWFSSLKPETRNRIILWVSRIIFSMEVALLVFAFFFSVPWDTVLTFAIFLLESIGLRF